MSELFTWPESTGASPWADLPGRFFFAYIIRAEEISVVLLMDLSDYPPNLTLTPKFHSAHIKHVVGSAIWLLN